MLVLVVWVFNRAEGVKAWLDIIWDMTIQPSEFIKLAMILMLAQRLSQSEHPMSTFRDFIEKYHPQVLAHGHVHQSYHYDFARVRDHAGTQIINACGSYLLELEPGRPGMKNTAI